MNIVIVLPTYNESKNIEKLVKALDSEFQKIEKKFSVSMQLLVVDDTSPDKTADIVKILMKKYAFLHLLMGKKAGLGKAYLRGFAYAIGTMSASVVLEMDADFSHDPKDVIRLITPILTKNVDFVIGSRYIKGGSIPKEWSLLRKMNSRFGNIFARYIAGIYHINDCTAGFRAIKADILNQIDYKELNVSGYSFQMNLLFAVVKANGVVVEVPVHFIDRQFGESKIRMNDIIEFMINAIRLRFAPSTARTKIAVA